MKFRLGFYSHIPIARVDDKLYMPAFIGKYVDGIADECEIFLLFSHTDHFSSEMYDYELKSNSLRLIDLGSKKHALIRFLFGFINIIPILHHMKSIDQIIVRAPTPLSHWFKLLITNKKLRYLIIADEKQGAKAIRVTSIKKFILKNYLLFTHQIN